MFTDPLSLISTSSLSREMLAARTAICGSGFVPTAITLVCAGCCTSLPSQRLDTNTPSSYTFSILWVTRPLAPSAIILVWPLAKDGSAVFTVVKGTSSSVCDVLLFTRTTRIFKSALKAVVKSGVTLSSGLISTPNSFIALATFPCVV
ncbi:hypothetical protein D3C77_446530 [compost metagenome]